MMIFSAQQILSSTKVIELISSYSRDMWSYSYGHRCYLANVEDKYTVDKM